jgi:hypothetical protein
MASLLVFLLLNFTLDQQELKNCFKINNYLKNYCKQQKIRYPKLSWLTSEVKIEGAQLGKGFSLILFEVRYDVYVLLGGN